jgi:uncharacterized protein (DUF1501 family)
VTAERLDDRRELRNLIETQVRGLDQSAGARSLDVYQDRAFRLLTSPKVQAAFQLSREPEALRDRYGRHTYGQSCLLARRLVEAGVKLVTVFSANNGKIPQDAWDTHSKNFPRLRELLPLFDQGTSALIDDLHGRGLSERTLLLVMSEFGRSPRINAQAGRDHWANCYSIMLMGGGVRPGQVQGQSDRIGAFPLRGRVVTTADITATVYHCLGIDGQGEFIDPTGRPQPITTGTPMSELF